jgi:hypothetical protein
MAGQLYETQENAGACDPDPEIVRTCTRPPWESLQASPTRIVVRPHMNRDVSEILANDIEETCENLEQHGGTATSPKLYDAHKTSAKC